MKSTLSLITAFALLAGLAGSLLAEEAEDRWPLLRESLLGSAPVVETGVAVVAPSMGENAASVPVTVEFDEALGLVEEFMVLVDRNPFPMVARVKPEVAFQSFSLRIRMERSSPVRVAARTADGIWHVAYKLVRVSGGGCSVATGGGDAVRGQRHGQVNVAVFGRTDGTRMRFQLIHPMETGLAMDSVGNAIPPFYIYKVEVRSGEQRLYSIELSPIAKDPTFSTVLDLTPEQMNNITIAAVDTMNEHHASKNIITRLDPEIAELLREKEQASLSASN